MQSVQFNKTKLYFVKNIFAVLHNIDDIEDHIPLYSVDIPILSVHPTCYDCHGNNNILNRIDLEYDNDEIIQIDVKAIEGREVILSNFIQLNKEESGNNNVELEMMVDVYVTDKKFKKFKANSFPVFSSQEIKDLNGKIRRSP